MVAKETGRGDKVACVPLGTREDDRGREIGCVHCRTRLLVIPPPDRVGYLAAGRTWGAVVRCPACRGVFSFSTSLWIPG